MKKLVTLGIFILLIILTGCVRRDVFQKQSYVVHIIYMDTIFSSPKVVHEGETLEEALGVPFQVGKEFVCWETMQGDRYYPEDTITDNQFFYEIFDDIKYQVVFETNGGVPMEPIYVTHGVNFVPPTPIQFGLEFEGWFLNSALSIPYVSYTPIKSNLHLYAKWRHREYTVYYQFSDNEWYRFSAYPTESFPTIDTSQYPTFEYWFETDPQVPFVFPSLMPNRNIVLRAKYQ